MARSLRTRLFVTMAVLLAVSIGASALLSRRATLVEVRQVVTRPVVRTAVDDLQPLVHRIVDAFAGGGAGAVSSVLARAEQDDDGRQWILLAADLGVVAASNPGLAGARITHATPDGDLAIEIAEGGGLSTLDLRGVPTAMVREMDARLYALPAKTPAAQLPTRVTPSPWIVTTLLTALAAVALTFGLSRHILGPIGALTAAAGRMTQGDLAARVDVRADDEIGGLARAFNTMAEQLQHQEEQRRQMVADVAHELRAPVTNLRCTLEAMQDGLTPIDRPAIDVLHEETLCLQRAIADLQDLALADAGRLIVNRREVSLSELLHRAAASFAGIPGAPIAVSAPSGASAPVDPDRVEQLVRNLLSNARRHTPPSGRIDVAAARVADIVTIEVADTGSGIAPQHVPHVFERFYRVDGSRTRATGGTGLGLSIAREIARAHGGDIHVASAGTGAGAVFTVTLRAAT